MGRSVKAKYRIKDLKRRSIVMSLSGEGSLTDFDDYVYRVEAWWEELEDNPKLCSFQVDATNKTGGAYITQLNLILSTLGLTGEERFAEDSTFIVSKTKANKFYNIISDAMGDPIWRNQLLKEIDEDCAQGWEPVNSFPAKRKWKMI